MSSSRVAQQIRALVSSSTVRGLMNLLLPQPTAQLRTPASRRARALCSMLSGPLATQALQHDTRLALAVNPELVPRLWNAYLKVWALCWSPPAPVCIDSARCSQHLNGNRLRISRRPAAPLQ